MTKAPAIMVALTLLISCPTPTDPYQAARERMVALQIQDRGVKNPLVLSAMRGVPRHLFVPPAEWPNAYEDHPLAIGYRQTISQPYIVALMTELVRPSTEDRALEVGTGSGYQAAVLSGLVKQVYTVEILEPLGKEAARRLKDLGYSNVQVRVGDGYQGWPEEAPFDIIVVTAAPETVPPPLLEQLGRGGRMVIPVGRAGDVQSLQLLERDGEGNLHSLDVLPVQFVPLTRPK